MSGINLSDVLEYIKGRFRDYNAELNWEIDNKVVSLEDVQTAIKNKKDIRILGFGTPDISSYSFNYYRELEWTINVLFVCIEKDKDGNGYNISSEVIAYADEDLSRYYGRDDFDSIVNKIWSEMEKEGVRHAAYNPAIELGGDYTNFDGETYETIEEALCVAQKAIGQILDAIAAMEDFYIRVINHYGDEIEDESEDE